MSLKTYSYYPSYEILDYTKYISTYKQYFGQNETNCTTYIQKASCFPMVSFHCISHYCTETQWWISHSHRMNDMDDTSSNAHYKVDAVSVKLATENLQVTLTLTTFQPRQL